MKIHLIAIGGAIMHNLAMELHDNGHEVTGSDDAIYDPALSRLRAKGILPAEMGWHPERIHSGLDLIILGMHARHDNEELIRAQQLNLNILSFPEFMFRHAKDKTRVVIAGSHGKTTTTSMVLHLLRSAKIDADYLVGAQLEGFGNMVRLSDAPIAVFEGDEYTASPLDLRPKFLHYQPHFTVITGIAWDHINVFPTHDLYKHQFELLAEDTLSRGTLIYYEEDPDLKAIADRHPGKKIGYTALSYSVEEDECYVLINNQKVPVHFFGKHNFENMCAAYHVVRQLGMTDRQFIKGIRTMPGPARRLEVIRENNHHVTYFDFAHAPSKVDATVRAVRERYPHRKLIAVLELHTFSSLNKDFIPQYAHSLDEADTAIIFYNPATAIAKQMDIAEPAFLVDAFKRNDIQIIMETNVLRSSLLNMPLEDTVLLIMTSGNFGGIDVRKELGSNLK
ncbi:MAG: hypothetical protein J5I59_02575 [Saprospiraceae bacterium]|nr:hypothetical protein [Saprospiraceae bacterium]